MSTTFPTSKQSFAEPPAPTTTSLGDVTYPHTAHHTNLGDTLEALQDRVGYGAVNGMVESYVATLWNSPMGPTAGTTTTQDTLYLRQYVFPTGTMLTQLGIYNNVTGTATSVVRLGIYNDDGTGCYPGTLLVDGGVTTADLSTTGFKSCTAFTATDCGGIKWVGGVVQVAAAGANGVNGLSSGGRGMAIATPNTVNAMQGYALTGITGALPTPYPARASAGQSVTNSALRVFYKGN